jgi:MRC1-like domain
MTPYSQRLPLGTISHSPLFNSDDENRLCNRRLRRQSTSGEKSETRQALNAISVMLSEAKKQKSEMTTIRRRTIKHDGLAEFIVDEAEESDEEAQFGFGEPRVNNEESNENLDAVVEDLLDDTTMDVDVENSEKVIEKFQ